MTHLVVAPRAMAAAPALQSRSAVSDIVARAASVTDGASATFEQRPVRMGGAPLTGALAVELYRRTQWLQSDVLVARLDLTA